MKKKITTQKAFASSAGKTFAGLTLHPLTLQRQVAGCSMIIRNTVLGDIAVFLWLCSIPAESAKNEWTVDRAEIEPQEARKEAMRWAQRMGIGIGSKRFLEARKVFAEMMDEIEASVGDPLVPSKQRAPDEGEL